MSRGRGKRKGGRGGGRGRWAKGEGVYVECKSSVCRVYVECTSCQVDVD